MAEAEPHALEVLYDRHVRALYGLALRILQDQGDAESVVQAVFADVWTHMERADGAAEPTATGLLAATRRRAIERRRARSVPPPDDPAVIDVPMPALAGERPLLPAEGVARLRAALAELPVTERTAIELAGLEGMTAAEIAEHIEQTPETVRDRISTGLTKLRESLTA